VQVSNESQSTSHIHGICTSTIGHCARKFHPMARQNTQIFTSSRCSSGFGVYKILSSSQERRLSRVPAVHEVNSLMSTSGCEAMALTFKIRDDSMVECYSSNPGPGTGNIRSLSVIGPRLRTLPKFGRTLDWAGFGCRCGNPQAVVPRPTFPTAKPSIGTIIARLGLSLNLAVMTRQSYIRKQNDMSLWQNTHCGGLQSQAGRLSMAAVERRPTLVCGSRLGSRFGVEAHRAYICRKKAESRKHHIRNKIARSNGCGAAECDKTHHVPLKML